MLTYKPGILILSTVNGTQSTSSSITGAEYKSNGITDSSNNHDVPCAVCFSTAQTSHMFPAKVTCPDGWTEQYQGYLMTSRHRCFEYLCVDDAFQRARPVARNFNWVVLLYKIVDLFDKILDLFSKLWTFLTK